MKILKKVAAAAIAASLAFTLCACSSSGGNAKEGSVYWLNFKLEIAAQVKKAAQSFTEQTGISCTVKTAASGEYEQTLTSEMAKDNAPTLFNVNGPVGLKNWQDYCYDLTESEFYENLSDKSLALKGSDGAVYGVPNTVEAYGIIYHNAIMNKYFSSEKKKTKYSSVSEINNFTALEEVVEDMTAMKDYLGIKGVFANTSMSAGNQWRWQTHLANMPFYYEFKQENPQQSTVLTGLKSAQVKFSYADSFKNIFDLYINNSTTQPKLLGSKSVDDSMAEFALGQCAMVQNGNWAWGQISGVKGNTVKKEDVAFMPIYTGIEGEESQGICIGTENYFAVNNSADEDDIAATMEFLNWLFNSETGKKYVVNEFGFIAPFKTFSEKESPADPLAKSALDWMNREGVSSVEWTFACFPSETFKDDFGGALLKYVQGQSDWDSVVKAVKDSWAKQYKLVNG